MQAVDYLIRFLFETYVMLLILRFWLQAARADFYNPFSQFVVKATAPVVNPFRRIIPGFGGFDIATLVVAFLVMVLKYIVLTAFYGGTFNVGEILFISFLSYLKHAGLLVFWVMILMALMSWVVQPGNPVQFVFHQLTQPLLNPIRRVMPDLGGIDLSVIIFLVALNFINRLIIGVLPAWQFI